MKAVSVMFFLFPSVVFLESVEWYQSHPSEGGSSIVIVHQSWLVSDTALGYLWYIVTASGAGISAAVGIATPFSV